MNRDLPFVLDDATDSRMQVLSAEPQHGPQHENRTVRPALHWPRWGWLPYALLAAFVGYWALTHIGAVVSGCG